MSENQDDDRTKSVSNQSDGPDRPRIERLGQFKIESTLGSGGMGTIYRAFDESMKRPVALKVLHSSLEISEQAQTRFVREAWIAGQLDHPNIVKVYSRGEENKVSYLAMELVDGGSLYDYIERTRKAIPSGSDITTTIDQDYINDILGKFIELANALEHIHNKGFIHRDIKPHNILLSGKERKFKFTDFGIAHADDMTRMTRVGDFIGTVKYMSPELLAAHRAGIDKRTDIYSLGVTLYEALTLSLPFKADSEEKLIGEILAGHYNEARKNNRRIPVDLETVLMKACNHDPDQRYHTAVEFADDLQRIIDGRPILAKRPRMITCSYKYIRRNYRQVLGIVTAVVVIIMAAMWSYYQGQRVSRPAIDRRPEKGPTLTKIDVPGLTEYCALSPDGEKIAFVAEDQCLWVAQTHSAGDPNVIGEAEKLTGPLAPNTIGSIPVWSADGHWIAFNGEGKVAGEWADTLAMYVILAAGGEPAKLSVEHDNSDAFFDFRISLSPDGREIAFFSHTPVLAGDTLRDCIYSMPVNGGEIQRIAGPSCGQPSYSPDGKMIAFLKGDLQPWAKSSSPRSDVWIMPAKGGKLVRVCDVPGVAFSPTWSPESNAIAFGKWEKVGDGYSLRKLYVSRLSKSYEPMGKPIEIKLPHDWPGYHLCGWDDKNRIGIMLGTSGQRENGIYKVPVTGGVATKVVATWAYCSKWSPNGKSILYSENDTIFSVPATGGEGVSVFSVQNVEVFPIFDVSPDGKWVAQALTEKGDSVYQIHISSLESSASYQLTADSTASCGWPQWSPDGKSIAFWRFLNWRTSICVIPAVGGEIKELVDDTCIFSPAIAWSPDGKLIAYTPYSEDSVCCVKTVPSLGGFPRELVRLPKGNLVTSLSWSPDGKKLSYGVTKLLRRDIREDGSLWDLLLDICEPTEVHTGMDMVEVDGVDWSPNGQSIAFSCGFPGSLDFYLMENFLPSILQQKPKPMKEPTFSMINVPGLVEYCALSPDGSKIAYVADDSCLWVAPTQGVVDSTSVGEAKKLTRPIVAENLWSLPVWSADGNWIAFNGPVEVNSSSKQVTMCIVPAIGGEVINVPFKHSGSRYWVSYRLSLSPDGKNIAFSSNTSPLQEDTCTNCIYSVSIRSGQIKRLTNSNCEEPAYSPDGKMLAYVKSLDKVDKGPKKEADIWIIPADGGKPIQVTDLQGYEFDPVWSPDGKSIAFARWKEVSDGSYQIWEIRIVQLSDSFQPLARQNVIELPIPGDDFLAGWSKDNTIAFVFDKENMAAVYSIPVSGGIATQITPDESFSPALSPDGRTVYYLSDDWAVHYIPIDGGEPKTLTVIGNAKIGYSGLDISPDGKKIALVGMTRGDSTRDIFTMPVQGGELEQLTSGPGEDWYPAWSPNGDWIAFDRSINDKENLCLVSATGGEVRDLIISDDSSGYVGYEMAWSRDGKYIAYQSYNGSTSGLSIIPFEGGESELLVQFEPGQTCPALCWSPDGRSIAYSLFVSNYGALSGDMWLLSLETRESTRIRTAKNFDFLMPAQWTSDGKKIIFTGGQIPESNLCLIRNFLP